MQLEYELDKDCLPKKIHIIPSKHEDIEMLHNISSRLIIENPSLAFVNSAKQGLFDKFTDEEYEKILAVAKRLNSLFYSEKDNKPKANINIFDLLVRLLYEYMLNNHDDESLIL